MVGSITFRKLIIFKEILKISAPPKDKNMVFSIFLISRSAGSKFLP